MLDGVITFFASHHAMRAEKVLKEQGVDVKLVPGPRELSPTCGVALRFPYAEAGRVQALLAAAAVETEQVACFPEAQAAPKGWGWLRGNRS